VTAQPHRPAYATERPFRASSVHGHPGRRWLEQDAPGRLRARLTQAVDLAEALASLATAADVPGICAAVEAWLRQFLDSQER
jgi:hypothetical protein